MLWSIVPDRFQWTVLLIIVIGSGGLFFLTKWSLGLRLTLSRRQKRQYLEMKEHVEEVVNAKKVILILLGEIIYVIFLFCYLLIFSLVLWHLAVCLQVYIQTPAIGMYLSQLYPGYTIVTLLH